MTTKTRKPARAIRKPKNLILTTVDGLSEVTFDVAEIELEKARFLEQYFKRVAAYLEDQEKRR